MTRKSRKHEFPPPEPQAPQMGPSPVPTGWGLGIAENPGTGDKLMLIQFQTPVGQFFFFFDRASANKLGNEIVALDVQLGTKLHIPPKSAGIAVAHVDPKQIGAERE